MCQFFPPEGLMKKLTYFPIHTLNVDGGVLPADHCILIIQQGDCTEADPKINLCFNHLAHTLIKTCLVPAEPNFLTSLIVAAFHQLQLFENEMK